MSDTKEQSIEPRDEPISQPVDTLFGEPLEAPFAEPLVGETKDVGSPTEDDSSPTVDLDEL